MVVPAKSADKNILQSKTIWGVLILLAAFGASKFLGIEISEGEQTDLVEKILPVIETGGALLGTILAVYGRVVATAKVKLL